MATIKDIAKRAGVSHGTVSNVLNKKGNVSAKKIQLVEKAAQELGYTLNHQAAGLRKGSVKLITVIIPYQSREKYDEFYSGMLFRAEEKEYELSLVYLRVRTELKELLDKESAKMPESIVLLGLNPKEDEMKLVSQKVNILIYNDQPDLQLHNVTSWFYDAKKVIENMHREVTQANGEGTIYLAIHLVEQDSYWVKEITKQFPNHPIKKIYLDNSTRLAAYFELLNQAHSEDTLIFLDSHQAEGFLDVVQWSDTRAEDIPAIYSFSSQKTFHHPLIKYLEFNYKKDGYQLMAELIKNKKKASEKMLASYPLSEPFQYTRFDKQKTLSLLTLESPMSDALDQVLPIFEKKSGLNIHLVQMPYRQMRDFLFEKNQKDLAEYDLIRLDVAWMEAVGETIFTTLENDAVIHQINQSLSELPKAYSHIHDKQYALPLDASMQVLFYRKDLFEDLLIQRQFFELYKRELKVPETFQEFDEVAQYFSKKINPTSPTKYGHSYAQDNPDLLVSSVLPRINEYLSEPNNLSREEVFQKSIEEYKLTAAYSHTSNNIFWSNIAKNFANGLTAMEILYSNYAADILTSTAHFDKSDIGYSVIPGRASLLGGGSLGISKWSENYEESVLFLDWLYSDEISEVITSLGGVLHNKRTNENMDIINIYPWMRKMNEYFSRANRLMLGDQRMTYEEELELGKNILEALKK